ncbi:hypothetical protein L7F22_051961 [Adiantum nelumboides]|nr:hypothetical protein [Adiantum nelumboides]
MRYVRHIMRYVRATLDYALFYDVDTQVHVHGYTDSDWVRSVFDRRSTSGYMFSLENATFTWSSKKQPTVALSSTEVEYKGAAVAACDVGTQVHVHGYTDSDWVGSVSDRRSTSGYMFSFENAAVTWSSKIQPTVALSSTKIEYRGAAVAACEVAWLKMLLRDLEIQVQGPVVIYCDNLSSIQLARNPVFHAQTKHTQIHYHFIRERVLNGDIDLAYVGTEDQAADLFTKALGAEKLQRFRGMLGLRDMALSLRGSVEISSFMPT